MGYTSLASLVADLREALGDGRREPRFIRTVHGYGYAFCGEAREEPARAHASAFACSLTWGGRSIGLLPGENVIGRDDGCAVRMDLPRVSRRHTRILVDGVTARIGDLGSKNGTRVRQQPLTSPVDLADGGEIEIGGGRLAFRRGAGPGSTLTGNA